MRDVEVPKWLKGLPLAPEFRPTDTEFADPIAYISKIEKEASAFGICKVIPPLPKSSKKYVLHNLNKTLSKFPELGPGINVGSSITSEHGGEGSGGGDFRAVFTTRHQELGQSGKRVKGTVDGPSIGGQRQVWQSGEVYTLEQFEAKSKTFAKSQLSMVKEVSPLVIETMFWKAASEKPIYVEYANDVPGSGFGEPDGSFRYLHRQRRRRRKRGTFDRNNQESCGSKNHQVVDNNSAVDKHQEVTNPQEEASFNSTCSPTDFSTTISMEKCSNAANEMVGTAGWKLANSAWNLQVIARSPGSLTRFMPDDIPGVTSPMVYIGMLFSWFAWHVEDHELHSLNYLHMGSPKTWYAVPGDCAFTFEEVIREHAYGENVDHLDALSLLGEKTTLLSPEVVVASGIPCCRLIQNPGEFVVTFPRAYHVGFSHGFNCGEAANFATPKWLSVAKEAAVRRAAMKYLPMLSHQQLLYLLTMSFISRVPRSLLPGARSSRLRDRLKEERELSVKRAFIEDMLKENHLLTKLLEKNPCYHVVLWDLNLLSSSSKQSQLCVKNDTIATTSSEKNQSHNQPTEDLYTQMSLYMDGLDNFYADDADGLLSDYQVESGTLPCVACGILGFPFMAIVQPTDQAFRDLLAEDPDMIRQLGASEVVDSRSVGLSSMVEELAADARNLNEKNLLHPPNQVSSYADLSQSTSSPEKDQHLGTIQSLSSQAVVPSANKPGKQWNLSLRHVRPRIFCLEHAIQTVDHLSSKGGANVLGLCHSDFQKIKAHAAIVAEEIGCPFTCNEIPLDNASQEDLFLIDHATDNQEKEESMQDWTSKFSISLRDCVNMRKDSQKVQDTLTLDGLSSDTIPASNAWKWQSRRSRSTRNSNPPTVKKPSLSRPTKKVKESGDKGDAEMAKEEDKPIIQYYRKRYKSVSCHLKGVSKSSADTNKLPSEELATGCVDPSRKLGDEIENFLVRGEHAENSSSHSSGATTSRDKNQVAENLQTIPSSSEGVDSVAVTTETAQVIPAPGDCISNKPIEKNNTGVSTLCHSEEFYKIQVADESTVKDDTSDPQITAKIDGSSRKQDVVQTDEPGVQCQNLANRDDVIEEASVSDNLCFGVHDSKETYLVHTGTTVVDGNGPTIGLSNCSTLDGKVQQEIQTISGDGQEISMSSNAPQTNKVQRLGDSPRQLHSIEESISSLENQELDGNISTPAPSQPDAKVRRKRKRELDMLNQDDEHGFGNFIRSPCEGLRPRGKRDDPGDLLNLRIPIEDEPEDGMVHNSSVTRNNKKEQQQRKKGGYHRCDIESCQMTFQTKTELAAHKRNRCHVEGCGKKFNSHKYAILHQRVHDDDRPLKCPWKGCKMSFKWAWARTEHLRVHTGERPYKCKVEGCGLTFRFVSDFSRHRRKTGHYV